jgi:hypothetical protein
MVAEAAHAKGWFKNVDRGRRLGAFLLSRMELEAGPLRSALAQLEAAVYAPGSTVPTDPAPIKDTIADDRSQS